MGQGYPRGKHQGGLITVTLVGAALTSVYGTKQTFRSGSTMSAFGGKADITRTRFNVCL
jgi:hypothetical protein